MPKRDDYSNLDFFLNFNLNYSSHPTKYYAAQDLTKLQNHFLYHAKTILQH